MNHFVPKLLLLVILQIGCGETYEDQAAPVPSQIEVSGVTLTETNLVEILNLSPLQPLPPNPTNQFADNEGAAKLGQGLFFDTRLSINGMIACATCHQAENDWTDGKPLSEGLQQVSRNAPTLWNLGYQRWYFWDGRKDSLWSQALGPIEHPLEMGGSRLRVYRLLSESKPYRDLYEEVFGELPHLTSVVEIEDARPVVEDPENVMHQVWEKLSESDQSIINDVFSNAGKSIAAYQRKLISTDSPFDQFVRGLRTGKEKDLNSLSAAAIRGLILFTGRGQCILCHTGSNFTDNEFHNIGLDRGDNPLDQGRYPAIDQVKSDPFNGKGAFSDDTSLHYVAIKDNNLGEFKTPTLRNVANTAPYMHDGRFASLREVVEFYSTLPDTPAIGHREESLQPLNLSSSEIDDLIAFLQSLTGKPLKAELMAKPTLLKDE